MKLETYLERRPRVRIFPEPAPPPKRPLCNHRLTVQLVRTGPAFVCGCKK